MAKTAEQILKAQGLSDADITAMAPMLTNASYRAAIENTVNKLESDVETWQQRDAEFQDMINNRYVPGVTAAEKATMEARRELAIANEKIKFAKDFGYLTDDDEKKANDKIEADRRAAATAQPGKFNVNDPDFAQFAGSFAARQGKAMATFTEIAAQHQRLFGEPLENFEQLYDKFLAVPVAQREQNSLKSIWEREYHVPEKRAEIQRKAQETHDAEVGRKAVEDYALKHGTNPNTATPNPSRNPFIPMQGKEGKQPWERPTATTERRQRAFENETRARVN